MPFGIEVHGNCHGACGSWLKVHRKAPSCAFFYPVRESNSALSKLAAARLLLDDDRTIRANSARRDLSAVALSACAVATVILIIRSDAHANAGYVNMNLGGRRACDRNRSRTDRTHHEFPHNNLLLSSLHTNVVGSACKRITLVLVHNFIVTSV